MKEMRECIMRQKVLVVVDDVGTLENLEALQVVAFKDGKSGSKMIVTTRNHRILAEYVTSWSGTMELGGIDEAQAMELFCYYAFHDIEREVKAQLYDEAEKIVKVCCGLPLSLVVIGQYLGGLNRLPKAIAMRVEDWKVVSKRLLAREGGDFGDEWLWKRLRISYDDLPEGEKTLFLDFACILWDNPTEDLIVKICGSSLELQNLKARSFIKLAHDKKTLVMHDQLRAMGKEIVCDKASEDRLFNMNRLWLQEIVDSLKTYGGHEVVSDEAIWLAMNRPSKLSKALVTFNVAKLHQLPAKLHQLPAKLQIISMIQLSMEDHLTRVTTCCIQSKYLLTRAQLASSRVLARFSERSEDPSLANLNQKQVLILLDRFICCVVAGEDLLSLCAEEDWKKAALSLFLPASCGSVCSKFALVIRDLDCVSAMLLNLLDTPAAQHSTGTKEKTKTTWNLKRISQLCLKPAAQECQTESDTIEAKSLRVDLNLHARDWENVLSKLESGPSHQSSELETYEPLLRKRLQGDTFSSRPGLIPDCFWIPGEPQYVILDVVGTGSSKTVLKCMLLGQLVAIAVYKGEYAKIDLEAEAGILARVQHPNVVNFVGCAYMAKEQKGYLVTELMEQDLQQLIKKSLRGDGEMPFSLSVSMDIILQIVEAMIHMRKCRVLHRDLKPQNCIVSMKKSRVEQILGDVYYVVKLIDFGTAKLHGPEPSICHTRKQGSTAYMAPEVHAMKDDCHYTWSADVYSFGMTCYEIISGKYPFEGICDGRDLVNRICSGKRPVFLESCPVFWKQLIEKCWHRNPKKRPSFNSIRKEILECYHKPV